MIDNRIIISIESEKKNKKKTSQSLKALRIQSKISTLVAKYGSC